MPPSRARYRLLAFTSILAIITYLDRVAISSAAPAIRREMGLDAVQMGCVFSAFTWAYLNGKLTDALVKRDGLKIDRSMGVVTLPIAGCCWSPPP